MNRFEPNLILPNYRLSTNFAIQIENLDIMGVLSKTLMRHKKAQLLEDAASSEKNESTITESTNESATSESIDESTITDGKSESTCTVDTNIDWVERHFQICLALLSRTDLSLSRSSNVGTVEPCLEKIIKAADKMVELLKAHSAENFSVQTKKSSQVSSSKSSKLEAKKCVEPTASPSREEKIWQELEELGYSEGNDIPYFHFNECCEELTIDVDSIDLDEFQKRFDVNIG